MLPRDWEQHIQWIAGHCAGSYPDRSLFTGEERHLFALDSITKLIHETGWPEDSKELFRAGNNGIKRELHEAKKHLDHWIHWVDVRDIHDSFADRVIDYVGVMQLLDGLTDIEREAVEALAAVTEHGGTYRDAAAMLGIEPALMKDRLSRARARARALWIAPGETPRGHYMPGLTPRINRQYTRDRRQRVREKAN